MGCNPCNGSNEEGSINLPELKSKYKQQEEFKKQFDIFLTNSESEKIKEEDFYSNIQKDYLNYSNEHTLNYPPELPEKETLFEVEPIKFKNGNIFKGKWNNENKFDGKGKYYIAKDDLFIEGIWDNGELKYGRIFLSDGNIYEGFIKDSKFNGNGKLILKDAVYEGKFENEEFRDGKMIWNNGYEYEGCFNGYCLQGKGKLKGPNGDIYEGDFKNNLFHGEGKYIYNSGNIYEGEFQYGIKKGKGKYISNNEYTYDGNWDNDVPFGYGKLTNWNDTCTLKCTFRAGKIAEEPIYEKGSKDNFNQDNFEIKPEEIKLNIKDLSHLNQYETETTQYKLGSMNSFLND